MKRFCFGIILILLFSGSSLIVNSQNIILKQTVKSGIYAKDQNIVVRVFTVLPTGDTLHIRVLKNNYQVLLTKDVFSVNDSLTVFEGAFREPCSVIVEAKTKLENASLGMLVDPQKLNPGARRPRDFEAYWKELKKSLVEMPQEIKKVTVLGTESDNGYSCDDIEINCPGTKPVHGYFAKPEKAEPGSLPIVLLVHAAGVKGSWCRSEPRNALRYAKMKTLCFDLNAHGMLNDQPESYYSDLEKGELKTYWLQGLKNRDSVYFRGMYLRLLRTIDYLTKQPEWDGRRILVIGESQGGGQALAAAGLDNRVSAVVAIVPAMCDWFGVQAGRMGGWPQPFESNPAKKEMMKALPYFDAANILKDSKAIIYTEIGLIDMVCPATSVYAAVNQAPGQKIICTVPYRPHHQPEGLLAKTWQEDFFKPRDQFISNYLK
jgi:cephalosporin-C deacetylase